MQISLNNPRIVKIKPNPTRSRSAFTLSEMLTQTPKSNYHSDYFNH